MHKRSYLKQVLDPQFEVILVDYSKEFQNLALNYEYFISLFYNY